jgi:hypothetical protein
MNSPTITFAMPRNVETKKIYSHLQTDRRTLSRMKPPATSLDITVQQDPSLISICGDVGFTMIGDEEREE